MFSTMITELVDDDAEIHGPDGEQVGRLAAEEQHREGEQQGQRHVDGHDQRACGYCSRTSTAPPTTRPMPTSRFSRTVSVVTWISSVRSA